MPRIDYHVHTAFSPDCDTPMAAQVARAAELGLDELCFTDHLELGLKQWIGHETDFEACRRACEELRRSPGAPVLRFGAEAGISCTPEEFERLTAILRGSRFDFVIASAHVVGDTNPMEPDFFEGRSFPEACRAYLAVQRGLRRRAEQHRNAEVFYEPFERGENGAQMLRRYLLRFVENYHAVRYVV